MSDSAMGVESGSVPADSIGVPWSGRELSASGFETDNGHADPIVVEALMADDTTLMAVLADARLLVPVVAHLEASQDVDGRTVDKSASMSSVTLTSPDGERALPLFTGLEALAAWDRAARPVPVTSQRAAQAALLEECSVIVLDLGSAHSRVLRPSMLMALAQGRVWSPADRDPAIHDAVAAAVEGQPAVSGFALRPSESVRGALVIELRCQPGLRPEELNALVTRVGEHLATDPDFRARCDQVEMQVVAAPLAAGTDT